MMTKDGFALILAIFLMLFISLLFASVFNMLTTDVAITGNLGKEAVALYLAEAGIERAVYELSQDNTWTSNGTVHIYLPSGQTANYYYIVRAAGSETIDATGYVGAESYSKSVRVTVSISGVAPGPYAVEVLTWEEL